VAPIVGDDSGTEVADKKTVATRIDVDRSMLSRWPKDGYRPSAETVVAFCRAYGRNPLTGLVAAGFITKTESCTRDVKIGIDEALREARLDDLLDELRRRVDNNERSQPDH